MGMFSGLWGRAAWLSGGWLSVHRIPCDQNGQPKFAKPNGDEAWVLILEKAMAKFKGSYAALDGGFTMWALECFTGYALLGADVVLCLVRGRVAG
jgi:hypothetical protein